MDYFMMDLLNFVLVVVANYGPLCLFWVLPSVVALVGLRRRKLDDLPLALWALIVTAIPLLGAIAFWILRPGASALPRQQAVLKMEGEIRQI